MPAFDSVMSKSRAMSVSSPIGMNSDVLKMNVANVRLMTGSQREKAFRFLSIAVSKNGANLHLGGKSAMDFCEKPDGVEFERL